MEKKETVRKIVELIKRYASFDGGGGERCPKCGSIIRYGTVYFDHREILGRNIAKELGLSKFLQTEFGSYFWNLDGWNEKEEPPYEEIAKELYKKYLN